MSSYYKAWMNKMRQTQVMGRRTFLGSIAGLAVSSWFGSFPFLALKVSSAGEGFVIINGWVLTRDDMDQIEVTMDVV